MRRNPSPFKWRHYAPDVILLCVRWYITYKLSYRDLVEIMTERGVAVSHTTILGWVQRNVPEFEKRWSRYARPAGASWRVEETYVRVRGRWTYLYRAVDRQGLTADFLLSEHRDVAAAKRLFIRAIERHGAPESITLDGHPATHCCGRTQEEWNAAPAVEGLDEQILEQPRRAGSPESEAEHLSDARLQELQECGSNDQRGRVSAEDQERAVQQFSGNS